MTRSEEMVPVTETSENVSTNGDQSSSGDFDRTIFGLPIEWWEGYGEPHIWKLRAVFGPIVEYLTKDEREHLNSIIEECDDIYRGKRRGQCYIRHCLNSREEIANVFAEIF